MPTSEDRSRARYEAAQAIVHCRAGGTPPLSATIGPGPLGHAGAFVDSLDAESTGIAARVRGVAEQQEARILGLSVGVHARCRYDPAVEIDARWRVAMLTQWGWTHRDAELRDRAGAMVDALWNQIAAVADQLLIDQTLTAAEIILIAEGVVAGHAWKTDLDKDRRRRGWMRARLRARRRRKD